MNPRKTGLLLSAAPSLLILLAVYACADVREETRHIADLLQVGTGSRVADLGAGDGELSIVLAEIVGASGKVYATEVEAEKVQDIKSGIERNGLQNVEVILGSQNSTGLPVGCCDGILIRLVYHHFVNPEKMQQDLFQALRPGGRIAIIDFGPENRLSRSNVPGFRQGHGVAADQVILEMTEAGFKLEQRVNGWNEREDRYLLVFSK